MYIVLSLNWIECVSAVGVEQGRKFSTVTGGGDSSSVMI